MYHDTYDTKSIYVHMEKNTYQLTLTGEGVTIDRTVSELICRQIIALVLGSTESVNQKEQNLAISNSTESSDITPKAFMANKRPTSDIERITCLAYYLTHHRGQQAFKTQELSHLNIEAAQPRFSNATVAGRNAVQKEFLSLAGGGKKQITWRGEALVNALPDRNQVKTALETAPLRKRRLVNLSKKRK